MLAVSRNCEQAKSRASNRALPTVDVYAKGFDRHAWQIYVICELELTLLLNFADHHRKVWIHCQNFLSHPPTPGDSCLITSPYTTRPKPHSRPRTGPARPGPARLIPTPAHPASAKRTAYSLKGSWVRLGFPHHTRSPAPVMAQSRPRTSLGSASCATDSDETSSFGSDTYT